MYTKEMLPGLRFRQGEQEYKIDKVNSDEATIQISWEYGKGGINKNFSIVLALNYLGKNWTVIESILEIY